MTDIEYVAIGSDRLAAMRRQGADEFGNPWKPRAAAGWEPLRCCLRVATEDQDIALISYSPWALPWTTPWAEAGPVFVCYQCCGGYQTPHEYPPDLRASYCLLNPFWFDGSRAYQHITFVAPGDDHAAAVRMVLSQPGVAHLHVRSATAQCYALLARLAT
jgi:hypothetical protein